MNRVLTVLLIITFAAAGCAQGEAPLVADFAFDVPECAPCTGVTFTDRSTGGTRPLTYLWDFGDGNHSSEPETTHYYQVDGDYVVTLTLTDSAGKVASKSKTVTIHGSVSALQTGWPRCQSGCTAKDTQIVDIWLVANPDCTPGAPALAELWATFDVNRQQGVCCIVAVADIYIDGALYEKDSISHVGDLFPGGATFDRKLKDITWICGSALTLTNIHVQWLDKGGQPCASCQPTCDGYLSSKCQSIPGPYEVTTQDPSIDIVKSASQSTYVLGDVINYTFTVENTGAVTLTNVSVSDPLPGLSAITPASVATLAPGATQVFTATYTITQADVDAGSVVNTATATGTDPDDSPVTDTDDETVTVAQSDLAVEKTVNNATPNVGDDVIFSITVTNQGPDAATGVQVTDQLPAGLSYVSSTTSQGTYTPATGVWETLSIPFPGTATLTITSTVTAGALGGVTNTASIAASDQDDPVPGNNTDDQTVIPVYSDVSITKTQIDPQNLPVPSASQLVTVSPSVITAGERIYYYLEVLNNGPNNSIDALITDYLPTGITNPEYSLNFGNSWQPWAGTRNLPDFIYPGSNHILLRGDVDPAATGTLMNTATVYSQVTYDPDLTNNESTVTTTVNSLADLSITKQSIISPVEIGGSIDYLITVYNAGPSDATAVTITDVIDPAIISGAEYSVDGGAIWISPWNGSINMGTLAYQGTLNLRIRGVVEDASPDPIPNTASVSSAVVDPDMNNNTITIYTPLAEEADISIVKTGPTNVYAGEDIVYTLTVTNHSTTVSAVDVVISDNIDPDYISGTEYSVDNGVTWPAWTTPYNIGTLIPQQTVTVLIRGTVLSDVTTNIINTATVQSSTPDGNLTNNTSTITTAVDTSADIGVEKTLTTPPSDVAAGAQIEYLITYYNNGPSDAHNVIIADIIPAGITNVTASRCGSSFLPWLGSFNAGTVVSGGLCTIIIRGDIVSSFVGSLVNTATVESDEDDPDTTDNTSTIVTPVNLISDLAVSKVVDNATPDVGTQVTFTIEVVNDGPSDATGVEVSDQLPSGYHYTTSTTTQGAYNPVTGLWTVGTLVNGGTASMTITADVLEPGIGVDYTNTATITSSDSTDPDDGNDADDQVVEPVAHPSLDMVKSASQSVSVLDDEITYTFTVTNDGNLTLTDVSVSDPLPGLSAITPASVAALAPGETRVFTATYAITQDDVDEGSVLNTATATGTPPIGADVSVDAKAVVVIVEPMLVCGFVSESGTGQSLEGWEVILEKRGSPWVYVESTFTDENGKYCFWLSEFGEYRISEVVQPGWAQVSPLPNEYIVTMPGVASDPEDGPFFNFENEQSQVTVGWESSPTDKIAVLAPWLSLALFMMTVGGICIRRRYAANRS